jgi:WD40 repeat protein
MRFPESSITLVLAAFILPGIALAVDPAWTAPGGSPVVISADGGTVLSDGDIFSLYDAGGTQLWRGYGGSYAQSRGDIYSPLAITADGMYSVLGSNQGLLYVDRTQRVFWQDSELHPIDDLSLSPDENYVASVAQGLVSVYTRGGDVVWRNDTYQDVKYVGISLNGLLTVAAGTDNIIHAYNQTGFELWNYTTPGIHGIRLSPADSNIIASSDYTLVCLHPSGKLLWKFYTGDQIRDYAISRDGSSVAAGTQGGRLVLVDRNGKEVFSSQLGNWVNAVSLSRDGSLVAAGSTDRSVYLFDRKGQLLFSDLTGSIVRSVALSSDGSAMAAASDMVYYYDLKGSPPTVSTAATPTPVVAMPPPAAMTTRPVVPTGTPPVTPTPTEAVPGETPTPESGSGPLAVLALGLGAVWILKKN